MHACRTDRIREHSMPLEGRQYHGRSKAPKFSFALPPPQFFLQYTPESSSPGVPAVVRAEAFVGRVMEVHGATFEGFQRRGDADF